MILDTATVLDDLLRASLDDCQVSLPPLTTHRVIDPRMAELAPRFTASITAVARTR